MLDKVVKMDEDVSSCKCSSDDTGGVPQKECSCRGVEDRLLTPFILLLLARQTTYGYELISSLDRYGRFGDASTVYKNLRRMEREGVITSDWETSESGPAKRVYHLTDDGWELLRAWRVTIEQNRSLMEVFLGESRDLTC